MAIEKVYLDPNAAAYTDDEIVGKVNTATANITKAGAIEATALSAVNSDDIGEGAANKYDTGAPPTSTDELTEGSTNKYDTGAPPASTDDLTEGASNKYDTGVPPTAVQTKDAIVAMDDLDRDLIISRPIAGQKKIVAIQTHSDGKQEIEQNDTAES